jgi:hypothetical protein
VGILRAIPALLLGTSVIHRAVPFPRIWKTLTLPPGTSHARWAREKVTGRSGHTNRGLDAKER